MSGNAEIIFANAELSLASYAVLASNSPTSQSSNIDALKQSGMSAKQAEEFAKKYPTILTQYNDTAADGGQGTSFSATVFKDDSGNLTLAIRGTAELFGTPNDLSTDSSIFTSGAGYDQIVAMYNWWMRASTPVGNTVLQYRIVPGPLDPHDGFQFGIQWLQIMPPVAASGQLVAAIAADPDHRLDITGHSLGGHLAMAFGSLFAAATSQVTTFNAPGFTDTASNQSFFSGLGGTVPSGVATTNVIADEANIGAVPWSAIAGLNSRPGVAVDVSVENQWLSDEANSPAAFNHSQQTLTDALAVYSVLSQLDPSLSSSSFKSILAGITLGSAASLERIVDAVEKLFGINADDLPTGNLNRDNLYQALYGLQSNGAFKALAGNAKIELLAAKSADAVSALAKSELAYRYALQELNPFAILGPDYSVHNTGGKLDLYDPETGKGELTESWLADRAAFLANVIQANTDDTGSGKVLRVDVVSSDTAYFEDKTSGMTVQQVNALNGDSHGPQYIFGGDDADSIIGGEDKDHLYGMAGNDVLDGGKDDDQLYGGGNEDDLTGGTGQDTLYGGIGNDILHGDDNAGGDLLDGGAGLDTYYADEGDTIRDSDGKGTIYLNGKQLTHATRKKGETAYKDAAGNVYILNGTTLLVNDPLVIEDFTAGDLGIELEEKPDDDDPDDPALKDAFKKAESTKSPIVLDLDGNGIATRGIGEGAFFDYDGNGFAERTGWVNTGDGLLVRDLNGDGKIGSDTLDGGKETAAGTGLWESSDAGKKYKYALFTEADGSKTLNIIAGTDRVFVKNFTDGKLGITLGVDSQSTTPSRTLSGTEYDDTINGDARDEQLEGRGGFDHLYGGAGKDRLYGDQQGIVSLASNNYFKDSASSSPSANTTMWRIAA